MQRKHSKNFLPLLINVYNCDQRVPQNSRKASSVKVDAVQNLFEICGSNSDLDFVARCIDTRLFACVCVRRVILIIHVV